MKNEKWHRIIGYRDAGNDDYEIKHINDLTSTTRETINVTSKEE